MADKKLKPGWRRVKFGDVVRLSKARSQDPLADGIERYVGLEHLEPGDLRIRSWGNVADGVTFTSIFQPGQVLFGKRRAYQRKVAVADFSGVCSGDIYVLETKDAQVLLPELLPFICQTDAFFDHAVGTSAGSLSPRTNWTSLADFEFALPPMDEQRRTLELLLAIEDEFDALEMARQVGRETEKVMLAHAIRGAMHSRNKVVKDSRFGPVPADWSVVPISQVADVAYGISESVASNKDPSIGWPILTGANITLDGTLDFSKAVYIAEPKKDSFILRKGDLLLNWRSGSEEHVGKTAIFDKDESYTYASFILRIRPDERMNRRFLWRLLNHMREFRLFGSSTSQQVNFKMNAAMFRDVEVVCPPRDVQDEIVHLLSSQWDVLTAVAERQEKTRALKQRALEGVL
ncbi:MAG: restriction endonuclease subunit S [Sphingobacteriia bacterium]|nr:restriction endonuclease subunit S [Sphingobacteriia bacterium]NCC40052.1 restriction endonuclease subunit S [Gammaproteobacteria bacterium]